MAQVNEMENGIMQVTYILNGPMDNLLLYCHIVLYRQRVTSDEKFSNKFSPWKSVSKISAFQCHCWKCQNAKT